MTPKDFEEANINYTKPEGWTDEQCGSLPTHKGIVDGHTVLTSCWQLTDEDLAKLQETREIWFQIYSPVQPPILLTVDKPEMISQGQQVLSNLEKADFEIGQIVKHKETLITYMVRSQNVQLINENKKDFELAKNQNPIPYIPD